MQSVESRNDEETCAELRHSPRIAEGPCAFSNEVRPLICLAAEKNDAACNRRDKKPDRIGLVSTASRGDSHRHQCAAADKRESHERNQTHVENMRLNGPPWAERAHEA